LAESNRTLEQY